MIVRPLSCKRPASTSLAISTLTVSRVLPTSEATSAVYYAPGQQEQAASIATTIGVKPAQVLPISAATPLSSTTGIDVVVVIGSDLAAPASTTTTAA